MSELQSAREAITEAVESMAPKLKPKIVKLRPPLIGKLL